uniref:Uncharacterized protein n=1 Tax=Lactuca sativa TaxID=4236 RepID=A0A9R1W4B0_LACSA|nr:hypothetical protein LSAT_V11C300114430 [Lactuca sativa]
MKDNTTTCRSSNPQQIWKISTKIELLASRASAREPHFSGSSGSWDLIRGSRIIPGLQARKHRRYNTHQAGRPRNINCIPSQGEEPVVRRCSRCNSTTHNAATCPTLVLMNQKKARKNSATSGSNTKGKGKGTQRTQETLETHVTQETR